MVQRNNEDRKDQVNEALITASCEEEHKEYVALLYTSTMAQAASTIAQLSDNQTDRLHVLKGIKKEILAGCNGGKDHVELMLMANAFTLDALFSKMICRGAMEYEPESASAYIDIGLRAQEQLRKVALALDQIRRPKQQIVQNNIAGIQQVTNNLANPATESSNPQNKLLDIQTGGAAYEARPKALDSRATIPAINVDEREADLVSVYRPENP